MRGLPENVPWKRFWIPRETTPALDWDGYLVDPETDYGAVANSQARTLEQLEETPCVALLGEPGIGKSRVLEAYCESVRAGDGGVLVVDCRWHHDLKEKLFATRAFTRWREESSPLTILMDSLDEHPLGASEVARQLVGELHGGRLDRLRLRIACRTAEWPGTLDEQLARLWTTPSEEAPRAAFYALAPLRRVDVALAAGQDATGFLAEVDRVGAEPLAIKPITLAFLLDEYRLNRKLPRERVTLYEAGCRRLCEETSLSRADRRRNGALHTEARLAIASRIAAVCILCRRSLVQVGVVRGAVAPEVVRLDEMVGGTEPSQIGNVEVAADEIREVLEVSGLFAPRGAGYVGWAHQTYAEFLAARFLRERGIPPEQLLREVSNVGMSRSVPALRETIAWLASMNKGFFQHLLMVDPVPLLGSDFAMVGPDELEALVGALLDGIKERALDANIIRHDRQAQARLVHPKLADQLRPYLAGRDCYIKARLATVALAVGGKVEALQNDLADLVLNPLEDDELREDAARAIVRIGSRETKRRLKPLILGEYGPDPKDELKGYALEALWPEELRAAELFANLTPSKIKSHGGSYGSFFHVLKKTLTPELLLEALPWTMEVSARSSENLSSASVALLDRILEMGWENIQDPNVRDRFAHAVRKRFAVRDGIFGCRNYDGKDDADLEQDDHKRRLLTCAIVALPPWSKHDGLDYAYKGLVLLRDVSWAIEQLSAEPSAIQRVRWASIISRFYSGSWSFEVADPIVAALSEIEELREAMHYLPLHVELGSPESRWMRRECRQERKSAAWFRRMTTRNRTQKRAMVNINLRQSLRDFESGLWDAAVDVQHWMSLERGGQCPAALVDWDIVTYPGWLHGDESVRASILAVGRKYLLRPVDCSLPWVADANVDERADAGYRYVCLLKKVDPAWFGEHSASIWKNWVAAALYYVVNDDDGYNERLIACAYRAAPLRVLEALGVLLERDHKFYGVPIVLHRVGECRDGRIDRVILDFAKRQDLKPKFLGMLLDDLISRKVDGAVEYAGSFLVQPVPSDEINRLRAHAAGHALMAYDLEAGWSLMWPIARQDPDFCRGVFLTFSREPWYRRKDRWGKSLSTAAAAHLFTWMEEQFPKDEDSQYGSGRSHAVTPRDMVGSLREGILAELESRGTPEAVTAFVKIQQSFPNQDFTSHIVRAKEAAAQGTWTPRNPREIIEVRPLSPPPKMNLMPAVFPSLSVASPAAPGTPAVATGIYFPPPLLAAYGQNKLAVLFGSGLSNAKDVKGDFPVWDELLVRFLDHVEQQCGWSPGRISGKRTSFTSGSMPLEDMLSELDTLSTALRGVRKYQAALTSIFRPKTAAPGDVHKALVELGVDVLATTNYDPLLEAAEGPPVRTPYTWMESDKALGDIEEARKVLFKIHGTADRKETVVMTQAEYEKAAKDTSYQRVMSYLLQSYTFLLVGYGINDPLDLDLVFELNVKAFGSATRTHYALMKDARQSDCDRWQRELNVKVIPYQDHADLPAILRQLRAAKP